MTGWKIGATKDFSGFVVGQSVVGSSQRNHLGTMTSFEAGGNTRVPASVAKTSDPRRSRSGRVSIGASPLLFVRLRVLLIGW